MRFIYALFFICSYSIPAFATESKVYRLKPVVSVSVHDVDPRDRNSHNLDKKDGYEKNHPWLTKPRQQKPKNPIPGQNRHNL